MSSFEFKKIRRSFFLIFTLSVLSFSSLSFGNQNNNEDLEITLASGKIVIEAPAPGDHLRQMLDHLTPAEQASFFNNRKTFLNQTAKALQTIKYGFGIGSLVKEKISFQIRKIQDDLQMDGVEQLPETVQRDLIQARDQGVIQNAIKQDEQVRKTMATRSQEVIQHILRALDQKLWNESRLFSHSNEFGLMGSVGIQAIGAMAGKGGFGGFFEVGFSIGFNKETKSLAFQIFRNIENFQHTPMKLIFVAGVAVKGPGLYIMNQKTGELKYKGRSFYPPMLPAYSNITERMFSTGPFLGLSVPPSPFSDIFTYTTRLDHKVMLRLTISPLIKSFVRMEVGFGMDSIRFFVAPVLDATERIINQILGIKSCSNVLL